MAWPTIIDDDGTGTSGTTLDKALFDAIKGYVDGGVLGGWQPGGSFVISDDAGTALTATLVNNRIMRPNPTTLIWQVYLNPVTLPVSSQAIWLSFTAFSVAHLNQMNPVALSSPVGLYVDCYSANRFRIKKQDQSTIAAGTYYVVFTSTWEVLP